jgi:hypothetical protein
VPILGVNCLIVAPDRTEEPIDDIADYSSLVASGYGCWAQAESHISARASSSSVFEVTLGDDPLEAV